MRRCRRRSAGSSSIRGTDDSPSLVGALDEAAAEIAAMLATAERPVLYVGAGVRRHGLAEQVVRLAERQRLPVVTDLLGKSAFPESHPQFAGIYMGALGDPDVRELVDRIGLRAGDRRGADRPGTGFWTQRIDPKARVMIDPDSRPGAVPHYDGLPMTRVVATAAGPAPGQPTARPRFDNVVTALSDPIVAQAIAGRASTRRGDSHRRSDRRAQEPGSIEI